LFHFLQECTVERNQYKKGTLQAWIAPNKKGKKNFNRLEDVWPDL